MDYHICEECGQKYCGWAVNTICRECGRALKKITWEEFHASGRIEGVEDDIADLKLKNRVNEYKEKYPEHFKEQ